MKDPTPSKLWAAGIPHHPKSLEVEKIMEEFDTHNIWDFGGDGDNGEDVLYLLDVYFIRQEEK